MKIFNIQKDLKNRKRVFKFIKDTQLFKIFNEYTIDDSYNYQINFAFDKEYRENDRFDAIKNIRVYVNQ